MRKLSFLALIVCMFALAGCQSTLDKEAAKQNDINMQRISRESDENNARHLTSGEITKTTKTIRDERNHKARRLARSMARDAGNEDLPIIPREIEKEPEWVDPEAPVEPEDPTEPVEPEDSE